MNSFRPSLAAARGALAWLRGFAADTRANIAILAALGASMIMAGAAFSVETSFDFYEHQRLATAADAAAYAGALSLLNGANTSTIATAAASAAQSNGWSATSGTIQVNTPPASGAYTTQKAVEVILTQTQPRFFTALFVTQPIQLHRRAVAQYQVATNACILALNRSASRAVTVSGSASMNLSGCDIVSDSTASDALYTWGAAAVSADCALAVGGISNNGAMNLSECPGGLSDVPAVSDPFSSLPTPSPQGPCINTSSFTGATLSPGYYCNGISLKGTDSLSPGVYYVAGGNFQIGANAQVIGSGVTIYLSGSARVSMQGNSDIKLTAPTTGTYAGILFFGDRNSSGNSNVFNGDGSSQLTGDLYFPSQPVTYVGNFSGNNGCTYVVADTVTWSGNATFNADCTAAGMTKMPALQQVRLVE